MDNLIRIYIPYWKRIYLKSNRWKRNEEEIVFYNFGEGGGENGFLIHILSPVFFSSSPDLPMFLFMMLEILTLLAFLLRPII